MRLRGKPDHYQTGDVDEDQLRASTCEVGGCAHEDGDLQDPDGGDNASEVEAEPLSSCADTRGEQLRQEERQPAVKGCRACPRQEGSQQENRIESRVPLVEPEHTCQRGDTQEHVCNPSTDPAREQGSCHRSENGSEG